MDEHLERQYLEVELYEKILVRERRRNGILITLTFLLFMFLSGIPVYKERFPKWQSLQAARKIAVAIEKLKTESIQLKKPLQLSLLENGQMKVEQLSSCSAAIGSTPVAEGLLYEKIWTHAQNDMALMNEVESKKFNMNFVVQRICFDPVEGLSAARMKRVIVVVPVNDLAESRLDRASYVEIESSSAKISIN